MFTRILKPMTIVAAHRLIGWLLLVSLAGCHSAANSSPSPSPPASAPAPAPSPEPGLGSVHLPPSSFSVRLDKAAAIVGDTLSCQGQTSGEGTLTYGYTWEAAQSPSGAFTTIAGANTDTLTVSPAVAHRWVRCQVVATDQNKKTTSAVSPPSAVSNSPATAYVATVAPAAAITGSVLTCSANALDPDADNLYYTYRWALTPVAAATSGTSAIVGAAVLGTNSVPTVPTPVPVAGENTQTLTVTPSMIGTSVFCLVSASDKLGGVTDSVSQAVLVSDTPPLGFTSSVVPSAGPTATPLVGATLACHGSTVSPVGDTLTYSYSWSAGPAVAGAVDVSLTPLDGATGATLLVTSSYAHKQISCQVVATDQHGGMVTSTAATPPVQVQNLRPKPFVSSLSGPAVPRTGNQLVCSGFTFDPDGDQLDFSYQWVSVSTSGGLPATVTPLSSQPGPLLPIDGSMAGLSVGCLATASDNNGGTTVGDLSQVLPIMRSRPLGFSASLTPAHTNLKSATLPGHSAPLTCSGSTQSPDASGLSYTYTWEAAQDLVGPWTSLPVDPTVGSFVAVAAQAHQWIRCTMVATDEAMLSTQSQPSPATQVDDSAPNSFSVFATDQTGTPSGVLVGDTLSCAGTTTDPDGDTATLTYSYRWDGASGLLDTQLGNWTTLVGQATSGPFWVQGTSTTPGPVMATQQTIQVTQSLAHRFIRCGAVANDGWGLATTAQPSQTVEVLNSPPASFQASISPAMAPVGTTVTCGGTTTDPDGDQLTYPVQWFAADPLSCQTAPCGAGQLSLMASLGSSRSINVPPELARRYLACQISATDGHSTPVVSAMSPATYVPGTPPAAFSVSLDLQDLAVRDPLFIGGPGEGQTQVVNCLGGTSSVDHNHLDYSYAWTAADVKDGPLGPYAPIPTKDSPVPPLGPTYETGSSLPVTPIVAHRWVRCTAVAFDQYGGVTQSPPSAPVLVANTAPAPFEAAVTNVAAPGSPVQVSATQTPTVVSCLGSAQDVDQDSVTYTYQWFTAQNVADRTLPPRDANIDPRVPLRGQTGPTLSVDFKLAHQWLGCSITADDKNGGATPTDVSELVQVVDSAPMSFQVSTDVSWVSVQPGSNVVTCVPPPKLPLDLDGDTVQIVSYAWYASPDGGATFYPLTGKTSSVLSLDTATVSQMVQEGPATLVLAHQSLACTALATDGIWGGMTESAKSPLVSYVNTKPEPLSASLHNASGAGFDANNVVGAVVFCGGATTDQDGDLVTYTYQWTTDSSSTGSFTTQVDLTSQQPQLPLGQLQIPPEVAHQYIKCAIMATDQFGGITPSQPSGPLKVNNSLPQITAQVAAQFIHEGETLHVQVQATDADKDNLTYSCQGGCPAGSTIDGATGLFSYTPGLGVASNDVPRKTFNPVFQVSDPYGGAVTSTFSLTVYNVVQQPSLTVECTVLLDGVNHLNTLAVNYVAVSPDATPLAFSLVSVAHFSDPSFTATPYSSQTKTTSTTGSFLWDSCSDTSYACPTGYTTPTNPSGDYITETVTAEVTGVDGYSLAPVTNSIEASCPFYISGFSFYGF